MTEETPHPSGLPREVRLWGMLCHLAALSGLLANGVGFLLGPLIVWLLKREDHPFVDRQGRESLNFQLTVLIAVVVSALLTVVIVGFFLLALCGAAATILPIFAAVRANDGREWRYPLTIRFLK